MNCSNCGRPNDNESNFCKYCGTGLREVSSAATNPHHTIFTNQYQPKLNTELGYLILALIIVVNVLMWICWALVFNSTVTGNEIVYKSIRVLSMFFSIGQFVVMFIFSKRQSYRIAIGIIAGIVILYNLYYVILALTNNQF